MYWFSNLFILAFNKPISSLFSTSTYPVNNRGCSKIILRKKFKISLSSLYITKNIVVSPHPSPPPRFMLVLNLINLSTPGNFSDLLPPTCRFSIQCQYQPCRKFNLPRNPKQLHRVYELNYLVWKHLWIHMLFWYILQQPRNIFAWGQVVSVTGLTTSHNLVYTID